MEKMPEWKSWSRDNDSDPPEIGWYVGHYEWYIGEGLEEGSFVGAVYWNGEGFVDNEKGFIHYPVFAFAGPFETETDADVWADTQWHVTH